MAVGLIALLDDVAALAKVAAASLDDVATTAAKAGTKAAGLVVDDAAVIPGYAAGFSPAREIPIVAKIGFGSLVNKLVILLPVALALGHFAPWAIMPLLLLGGLYLAYEGAEKIYEAFFPHAAHGHEKAVTPAGDAATLERTKVWSAIKTDFILSAEIMAITLSEAGSGDIYHRAAVLAVVAVAITVVVYGGVGLLVKLDDIGLSMSRTGGANFVAGAWRGLGRGLVKGMKPFMKTLTVVGTAAMVWVGGGIVIHALATFGYAEAEHLIHAVAEAAGHAAPAAGGLVTWLVTAALSGVVGLVIGAALIPVIGCVVGPLVGLLTGGGKDEAAHA